MNARARTELALLALLALPSLACAPRARMCSAVPECGAKAACVAGRCQPESGVPAILAARRVVASPVDFAYVSAENEADPPVATLGKSDDAHAVLLLRFAVPLPKDATIVEAYIVLDRADDQDPDPVAVAFHAVRIAERWDGRSTRWASQPRLEDVRAPTTRVSPGGPTSVRLDVRELVRRWRTRDGNDQGIAIVAENTTVTGMRFA